MAEQLFLSEEFDPSLYCVNARVVAHHFDWELFRPIEPLNYKAREAFNRQDGTSSCPEKSPKEEELLLFDISAIEAQEPKKINLNPKGAGREGEGFFSLLKIWELAPYYETEQNAEAIWRRRKGSSSLATKRKCPVTLQMSAGCMIVMTNSSAKTLVQVSATVRIARSKMRNRVDSTLFTITRSA